MDDDRNGFDNLFCLFQLDHRKLHGADVITDAAPF